MISKMKKTRIVLYLQKDNAPKINNQKSVIRRVTVPLPNTDAEMLSTSLQLLKNKVFKPHGDEHGVKSMYRFRSGLTIRRII